VGGSLFVWPELRHRLRAWLGELERRLPGRPILLVPGGGPTADVIRAFDETHRLGQECAHWLALEAMSLNGHLLGAFIPEANVVDAAEPLAIHGGVSIVDAARLARADERNPDRLPHLWSATSDAIAARIAVVFHAERLVLLKSADIPKGTSWPEAARQGLVDEVFCDVVEQAPQLEVSAVNLRAWRGWVPGEAV
jgi:aspartokinase-like uncharacterized kinase